MSNYIQTMLLILSLSAMFYIGYKTARNFPLRQKKYTFQTKDGKKEIESKNLRDYSSDYKSFSINWEKNSGLLFSETIGLLCIESEKMLYDYEHKIHTGDAKFFIFDRKNAYCVAWKKIKKLKQNCFNFFYTNELFSIISISLLINS